MARDEGGASPAPAPGVPGRRPADAAPGARPPGTPVAGPGSTPDEAVPPFGGSWRRLYLLVLANLAFWIAVMAALTLAYR